MTDFPCGHRRTQANTQFLSGGQRACRECAGIKFSCGHPVTTENSKPNGRGGIRCRECVQAAHKRDTSGNGSAGVVRTITGVQRMQADRKSLGRREAVRAPREEPPIPAPYVSPWPPRYSWEGKA